MAGGPPGLVALALLVAAIAPLAASGAAHDVPRAPRGPRLDRTNAPALLHVRVDGGEVRAWSDPDSTGQVLAVTYDAKARRWSPPTAWTPPVMTLADSLGWVHEFAGGLFDRFPRASLALGDGFTLARRDTGCSLVADATGRDYGWPPVTEDDIDKWGTELRVGLPRDFPEDRLRVLLDRGQLKNEPGPTAMLDGVRWFGLKGGFAGAVGQIGGLVGFDPAKGTFRVRRYFGVVEASVTRLCPWNGELWIGTARFGETAVEGISGLLLYRPAKDQWRQYSTRNSRIAGDLIWDIAAAPDGLWIATDGGLSRYDFVKKNFSSYYWHVRKDNKGYELTDRPPGDLGVESPS